MAPKNCLTSISNMRSTSMGITQVVTMSTATASMKLDSMFSNFLSCPSTPPLTLLKNSWRALAFSVSLFSFISSVAVFASSMVCCMEYSWVCSMRFDTPTLAGTRSTSIRAKAISLIPKRFIISNPKKQFTPSPSRATGIRYLKAMNPAMVVKNFSIYIAEKINMK